MTSIFGGQIASSTSVFQSTSGRIVAICTLYSGVILWIVYRSYIIAAISTETLKLSFVNPEGLLKSNFKLSVRGDLYHDGFVRSHPGTFKYDLYKAKVQREPETLSDMEHLQILANDDRLAYMHYNAIIRANIGGLKCKVIPAWISPFTGTWQGMAMKKGSPFFPAIRHLMMKYFETGKWKYLLSKLQESYSKNTCTDQDAAVSE